MYTIDATDLVIKAVINEKHILSDVIIKLLKHDNLDTIDALVNKANMLPEQAIIYIVLTLNYKAFNRFQEKIRLNLYKPLFDDNGVQTTNLAERLIDILNTKARRVTDSRDIHAVNEIRTFLTENYKVVKCECGCNLLDPNGEGIYLKARIPMTFDEYSLRFAEEFENYEPIDNEYRCYSCNAIINDKLEGIL